MMREMILVLTLSEEEQALWTGRSAMVVALNDQEAMELKGCINVVDDFVQLVAKSLATLDQAMETKGCDVATIEKTLAMLRAPARLSVKLNDRSRELLGRAVFIGKNMKRNLQ